VGGHLGVAADEGHVGLQELDAALVAELRREGGVGGAVAAVLGVAVAVEQPVADVERPLLGFPPRPRRPQLRVLRLSLLPPTRATSSM